MDRRPGRAIVCRFPPVAVYETCKGVSQQLASHRHGPSVVGHVSLSCFGWPWRPCDDFSMCLSLWAAPCTRAASVDHTTRNHPGSSDLLGYRPRLPDTALPTLSPSPALTMATPLLAFRTSALALSTCLDRAGPASSLACHVRGVVA